MNTTIHLDQRAFQMPVGAIDWRDKKRAICPFLLPAGLTQVPQCLYMLIFYQPSCKVYVLSAELHPHTRILRVLTTTAYLLALMYIICSNQTLLSQNIHLRRV